MAATLNVYKVEYTHELPGSDEFGKFSDEIAWLLAYSIEEAEAMVKKMPGINIPIKTTALEGRVVDDILINAQAMAKLYPATFKVPSMEDIKNVPPAENVKVASGGERFWVEVVVNTGEVFLGEVNNDLLFTSEHGMKLGDKIVFSYDKVYAIESEFFGKGK